MKAIYRLAIFGVPLVVVLSCAKPDRVDTFKSPSPDVFYTVETANGHGAVSSDFTRVYAHLESNGKSDQKLVLDGEYLVIGRVSWVNSNEVNICLSSGLTNSFRNEVTLIAGNRSETIRTHLQEQCQSGKER